MKSRGILLHSITAGGAGDVAAGEGQYRLRLGRFRFRYDIIDRVVTLAACSLRREDTSSWSQGNDVIAEHAAQRAETLGHWRSPQV